MGEVGGGFMFGVHMAKLGILKLKKKGLVKDHPRN